MSEKAPIGGQISIWIPVAFAFTGFFIGFTTGLSSSPVVKTLLPLIFGVIAGGGGFFAKKQMEQSRVIGISISALALMASIGVVQGIVIRDDSSWHDFWIRKHKEVIEIGGLQKADIKKYVALLGLRAQLQKTSFSSSEQNHILLAASQSDDPRVLDDLTANVTQIVNREQPFRPFSVPSLANQVSSPGETVLRTEGSTGN